MPRAVMPGFARLASGREAAVMGALNWPGCLRELLMESLIFWDFLGFSGIILFWDFSLLGPGVPRAAGTSFFSIPGVHAQSGKCPCFLFCQVKQAKAKVSIPIHPLALLGMVFQRGSP